MAVDEETYPLEQFLEACREVLKSNHYDEDILDELAPLMKRFCRPSNSRTLKEVASQAAESTPLQLSTGLSLQLIHEEPADGFAVYLATLGENGKGPIQSLDTWAVVGVVDGKQRLCLYARTDDRITPGYAKVTEASSRVYSHVFDYPTMCLCVGDIFETGNVQDTPSQAIHVYGRRLQAVERQEIDADQCTLTLHLPHSSPSPA
eukprot:EG_transcript_29221